jgi:hypothetical protein
MTSLIGYRCKAVMSWSVVLITRKLMYTFLPTAGRKLSFIIFLLSQYVKILSIDNYQFMVVISK